MAKSNKKPTKTSIDFQRRLSLYRARVFLITKIILIIFIALVLFTNILEESKTKFFNLVATGLANYGFELENLILEGQQNFPIKEILDALESPKGTPIFKLQIENIRHRLQENAWVKTVLVERHLPNTIYVAFIEKSPIALWQFKQKIYLIDEEGKRITCGNIEKFADLIHVVGQDANIYARILIEDLAKHPSLGKKVVSAVRRGQRRWDLYLAQNIKVQMPDNSFDEAYNYLAVLHEKNKLFNQNYKIINLRDPNKYYIEKYEHPVHK